MRSMTGYGEASGGDARHALTVSMRAVNHRFLDLQVRLAEEARASEAALRELVGQEVTRGRVELRVEVLPLGERRARVELNRGVVDAAYAAIHQLVEEGLLTSGLAAGDLLRLPEALRVELAEEGWGPAQEEMLAGIAREALAQLTASREREGASLAAALRDRLAALEGVVARLLTLRGPVREEIAAALSRRIAELLGGAPVDPARLAQEVALLVDRSDVSEELDRLRAHIAHFRELIDGAGPTGKRLDFLTQEVFRELNTLGAKCRNAEMTRAVLDAKVLCEQLREQVQNVE
jgi:uncharacterized protein (TIGR00255 family)